MNDRDERLAFLRGMLSCVANLYFTEYTTSYIPVFHNTPNEYAFHTILSIGSTRNYADYISADGGAPVVCSNPLGMAYIAEIEYKDGNPHRIHVLGPVFLDEFQSLKVETELDKLHLSLNTKREFLKLMEDLPVVNPSRLLEYSIMLHYALTGKKIYVSDFGLPNIAASAAEKETLAKDSHGTYLAEQRFLRYVEEGNLNWRKEFNRLAVSGRVGNLADKDYLRQYKNMLIIFTALCSRAAIRGGLASEAAFCLADNYIRSIEVVGKVEELTKISQSMIDDYVRRVHNIKMASENISPQIRKACELISLSPESAPDIGTLASECGYADYYFSKKFKAEVGVSVRDYVMKIKTERAAELLRETAKSITDISETLGFSGASHMSRLFKQHFGLTPGEYRQSRV